MTMYPRGPLILSSFNPSCCSSAVKTLAAVGPPVASGGCAANQRRVPGVLSSGPYSQVMLNRSLMPVWSMTLTPRSEERIAATAPRFCPACSHRQFGPSGSPLTVPQVGLTPRLAALLSVIGPFDRSVEQPPGPMGLILRPPLATVRAHI